MVAQAAKDRSKGGILPLTDIDAVTVMTTEQEAAEQTQLTAFAGRTVAEPSVTHSQAAILASSSSAGAPTHKAAEWYERGLALKKIGRYKEALEHFSLAAKDASFTFKSMAQIGICLKSTGQSEQAVTAFRKALQAQSGASVDAIQVRYLLGRMLESLARHDDTLEQYRWIRREEPSFKDVAERIERMGARRSPPSRGSGNRSDSTSWMAQLQRLLGASK